MPTLAAAYRRMLAQRSRKCLGTLGTQLAPSWRMSIDTFQTRPESTDGPTRSKACEGELEEFLRQAVGEDSDEPLSLREWLDLAEAWKITRTLRACGGNRSAAARTLGIGRRTLYAKMEKLEIAPTWALRGRSSATQPG